MNGFFFGTLCHDALRGVVLGRAVAGAAAELADHAVCCAPGVGSGVPTAVLLAQPGARASGLLLRDLTATDCARLAHYAAAQGYGARDLEVRDGGTPMTARVFVSDAAPEAAWDLRDWQHRFGAVAAAAAGDVMAGFQAELPGGAAGRLGQVIMREASRARAQAAAPVVLRFAAAAGDVAVAARREPYAKFFAVEEYDLAFRRFDRSLSPVVTRAVFVSGDAVTVLPYDPVRDRVLVIEQFRAGPYGRGDPQPWLIEAIAGRIDAGEDPDTAARREAMEEAGLTLNALLPVGQYYPSPGAFSEYLYSYVALVDLPDGVAGVFGVDGEAEDIRGHLIGFEALMALVASGEVANAPLILTALWLQRARDGLRGEGHRGG